jgi:hypothetical protein
VLFGGSPKIRLNKPPDFQVPFCGKTRKSCSFIRI